MVTNQARDLWQCTKCGSWLGYLNVGCTCVQDCACSWWLDGVRPCPDHEPLKEGDEEPDQVRR